MDQKLKWSLILVATIAVSILAIWGAWALATNRQNEQKKKLNGELIGLVIQASSDAVKELAEEKGEYALKKTDLVTEVTKLFVIGDIVDKDVTDLIDDAALDVKEDNQKKIKEVDVKKAIEKFNEKKSARINALVQKNVKDLMVEAVKKELEETCYSEAKSATSDAIKKMVEDRSFYDQDAKTNISKRAKEAAVEKAKKVIAEKFETIKEEVKNQAVKDLTRGKDTIRKLIITNAIKLAVNVTE